MSMCATWRICRRSSPACAVRSASRACERGVAAATDGMILGLGSDICDIRRIEAAIERHGDRFLQRVFTETERAQGGAPDGADPGGDLRQALRRQGGGGEGARHRLPTRRVLLRPRRGEPAVGPADVAHDRRRGGAAGGDHACGHGRRGRVDHDRRISIRVRAGDHFRRAGELKGESNDATDCLAAGAGRGGSAARLAARTILYTGTWCPCCGYYGYPSYRYSYYGYPPAVSIRLRLSAQRSLT